MCVLSSIPTTVPVPLAVWNADKLFVSAIVLHIFRLSQSF